MMSGWVRNFVARSRVMISLALLVGFQLNVMMITGTHSAQTCDEEVKIAACRIMNDNGECIQSCLPFEKAYCDKLEECSPALCGTVRTDQLPPFCQPTNSSCLKIHSNYPDAPTGIYNIELPNGAIEEVYCNMEGLNCGGEGGWTRVAYVNMTEPNATCPSALVQYSVENRGNFCGANVSNLLQCESVFFNTNTPYKQVCGRVEGYQVGPTTALAGGIISPSSLSSLAPNYLSSGVSITHGEANDRMHIWTFASGNAEDFRLAHRFYCPCNNGSLYSSLELPSYYCESGYTPTSSPFDQPASNLFLGDDLLWDGEDCNGAESTCCTDSNMPWFKKDLELDQCSTDDIETRVCITDRLNTNVYLQLIEIYVR